MTEEVKPRYTREQIAQMAMETVTVPKYSHEELVRMMNEAEGAPAQIVTPEERMRRTFPNKKCAEGAPAQIVTPEENPKVWTQAEIRALRLSGKLSDAAMAEIKQATAEGRVV